MSRNAPLATFGCQVGVGMVSPCGCVVGECNPWVFGAYIEESVVFLETRCISGRKTPTCVYVLNGKRLELSTLTSTKTATRSGTTATAGHQGTRGTGHHSPRNKC